MKPVGQRTHLRPALAALAVVAAVVVAGTAVLMASPSARSAVAQWLGVPGVDVRVEPEVTVVVPGRFSLGEPVSLAGAQRRAEFSVRVLDLEGDLHRAGGGVYFDDTVSGGLVHILYVVQDGLPFAAPKGIGAMLTQFRGGEDAIFTKEVLTGADVRAIRVGDREALWVSSDGHVLLRNRDGQPVPEATLSRNALLWTSADGVTYRLETALEMDEAVRLAETLKEPAP